MTGKTAVTILCLVALVLLLEASFVPANVRFAKLPFSSLFDFMPRDLWVRPPEKPQAQFVRTKEKAKEMAVAGLFDPTENMSKFYDALMRAERKTPGAAVRILHYGDSPTTGDLVTADIRSLLQKRFGDAGHGFVLISKPWAWYGHRGIELKGSGWQIEPASQKRARDGIHGLGGVNFIGRTGASATIKLPDRHERMELHYLEQPDGGSFLIRAKDNELAVVTTSGPERVPRYEKLELPPGTNEVTLTVASGSVRVFGWTFEKNAPGVVYSSLGLNGAGIQTLLRYFEVKQWSDELRHAAPDLVVLNYGTNESDFQRYVESLYEYELRKVIETVRAAAPDASLLLMSPMDRDERNRSGEIKTVPALPLVVEIQRKVAADTGCAFFNTYEMMGGADTMGRWYNSQPRLVSADFIHPMPAGAAIVGQLFEEALLKGYRRHKAMHSGMETQISVGGQ
jgi:lysophospholipase L1-like esterase